MYMYVHVYMCIYIYIYIYTKKSQWISLVKLCGARFSSPQLWEHPSHPYVWSLPTMILPLVHARMVEMQNFDHESI